MRGAPIARRSRARSSWAPPTGTGSPGTRRAPPRAKVEIGELAPERFRVAVEGDAPTLLVGTQKRFPPYWRTFLDGREVESFTADGLFLGVEVPAGRHTVEGRFVIPRAELGDLRARRASRSAAVDRSRPLTARDSNDRR